MRTLEDIHNGLRDLIAALERETARDTPDMAALSATRMKLTQASRRRAVVLEDLLDRARVVAVDAGLDRLVADTRAARFASAQHIGRWTLRAIEADWAGYRQASAAMRSTMRRQIEREAELLRPLLARAG